MILIKSCCFFFKKEIRDEKKSFASRREDQTSRILTEPKDASLMLFCSCVASEGGGDVPEATFCY